MVPLVYSSRQAWFGAIEARVSSRGESGAERPSSISSDQERTRVSILDATPVDSLSISTNA